MQAATERDLDRTKISEQEFIEQVWRNLNRMLEEHPGLTIETLARRARVNRDTLHKFRSRTRLSVRTAMILAGGIPQLGEGMRCGSCGRLPDIIFARR